MEIILGVAVLVAIVFAVMGLFAALLPLGVAVLVTALTIGIVESWLKVKIPFGSTGFYWMVGIYAVIFYSLFFSSGSKKE